MAYTIDQYNALQAAIAKGVQFVKYADKEVRYRSLKEMEQTLAAMADELGISSGIDAQGLSKNRRIVRAGWAKGTGGDYGNGWGNGCR